MEIDRFHTSKKELKADETPISCFPFISPDGLFEEEEESNDKE